MKRRQRTNEEIKLLKQQFKSVGLWSDQYKPRGLDDLVVNKKKVNEVKDAILKIIKVGKGPKILLLSGPSGSGKSTVVEVLAKNLELNLIEYQSNANQNENNNNFKIDGFNSDFQSNFENFKNFFIRSKRKQNIIINNHKLKPSVILLDELPNVQNAIIRDKFRALLGEYITDSNDKNPLIILINDKVNTIENPSSYFWFPQQFNVPEHVINIELRPIAETFALKALCNILQSRFGERIDKNHPIKELLKRLIKTFSGDLRASINQLQFLSLGKIGLKNLLKSETNTSFIASDYISQSLFHYLGTLFKKNKDEFETKMINEGSILNCCPIEMETLINMLFRNYLISFSEINTSLSFINILSQHYSYPYYMSDERSEFDYYNIILNLHTCLLNDKYALFPKFSHKKEVLDFNQLELNKWYKIKGFGVINQVIEKKNFISHSKSEYFEEVSLIYQIRDPCDESLEIGRMLNGVTKFKKNNKFILPPTNINQTYFKFMENLSNFNRTFEQDKDFFFQTYDILNNLNNTQDDLFYEIESLSSITSDEDF